MKINLIYDAASGGYSLKFDIPRYDKAGWAALKLITGALKGTIPASDRDYDPKTYTWFFHIKHFQTVKVLIENLLKMNGYPLDNLFILEKPVEEQAAATFIPVDVDVQKFISLTAIQEAEASDYKKARKSYLKMALALHPDRNPGDSVAAAKMSELNSVFTRLEYDYWKVKVAASALVEA